MYCGNDDDDNDDNDDNDDDDDVRDNGLWKSAYSV